MSTDIRVGDLVKFTNRQTPEVTFTSRVRNWNGTMRWYSSRALGAEVYLPDWDLEVLDRPLPPISDELVRACRDAYVGAISGDTSTVVYYDDWVKVINTVREYDRTNNKESK